MRHDTKQAFTLIELLMVIAIIGILAGILIPAVSKVKELGNITASKAQLSGYVNAIGSFKADYKFYPFADLLDENEQLDLSIDANSKAFIETLSARTADDAFDKTPGHNDINRKQIEFYTFDRKEFWENEQGILQRNMVADRFNNRNIVIAIDANGDGLIENMPDPEDTGQTTEVRTKVTAYVKKDDGNPEYYLY